MWASHMPPLHTARMVGHNLCFAVLGVHLTSVAISHINHGLGASVRWHSLTSKLRRKLFWKNLWKQIEEVAARELDVAPLLFKRSVIHNMRASLLWARLLWHFKCLMCICGHLFVGSSFRASLCELVFLGISLWARLFGHFFCDPIFYGSFVSPSFRASLLWAREFDVSLFEFTVSRMNHIMLPIEKMQSSVFTWNMHRSFMALQVSRAYFRFGL